MAWGRLRRAGARDVVLLCPAVDMANKRVITGEEVGRGCVMHVNVADADALWARAAKEGAKTIVDLKPQYWGDVYGVFEDPFGYRWSVCLR